MKTYQPRAKDIKRSWHLINAKGKVLGRMSTEIATFLMGKHKSVYASHMDMGDYVVVINAKDVELTGKKSTQKVYRGHSGYPGGFKEVKISKLFEQSPTKIVEKAAAGMLPNNRLRKERMNRLKIFADDKHPYKNKMEKEVSS